MTVRVPAGNPDDKESSGGTGVSGTWGRDTEGTGAATRKGQGVRKGQRVGHGAKGTGGGIPVGTESGHTNRVVARVEDKNKLQCLK